MKKNNHDENIIKGRWYNINKKIKKRLVAKYHKIKDWKMDPKGYFLIHTDLKEKLIHVGYCPNSNLKKNSVHELIIEIQGKTAIEIVNTLIREKFISTLQHAADMGIELHKAELSLKYGFNLTDDGMVGQQLFAGEATRLAYGTEEAKEGRDAFVEKRDQDYSSFDWAY